MKIKILLLTLALLLIPSCGSPTELNGEVFIVTKGASNIKLGAVQILVIPEKNILGHIEGLKSEADRAYAEYEKQLDLCSNGTYPSYMSYEDRKEATDNCFNKASDIADNVSAAYFVSLPTPVASGQTNGEGKFNIKIPSSGKYAVVAKSERAVGEKTEQYYWMVWVDADGAQKQIILSNNNMAGTNSADQVLPKRAF